MKEKFFSKIECEKDGGVNVRNYVKIIKIENMMVIINKNLRIYGF
jgi:hypothetical protein